MKERYEIMDRMGKGKNSEVYKAFDRRLNRYAAVKKQCREEADILREANVLMKLKHPAIPVVYDVYEEERCLVMEYMEGTNLLTLLEEGPLSEEKAVKIGIGISECLQYLHGLQEKMIYRDLKPANILIDKEGRVKLIDFDSVYLEQEKEGKRTWSGTYGYSAPEQFEAGQKIDERSDIYGVGATLYHLLTGRNPSRPPYHFYKIREVNPLVSKELEQVVGRCMEKEKEKRYADMTQVLDALQRLEKLPKRGWHSHKKTKGRYMVEQKKNVILTEKSNGGLFVMLVFLCFLTFLSGYGYGKEEGNPLPETIYAKEETAILPLITYNGKREQIIIKNGAFYETAQDFHMALPKECLGTEGAEVTVICKKLENGNKSQRVLLLKEKEEAVTAAAFLDTR